MRMPTICRHARWKAIRKAGLVLALVWFVRLAHRSSAVQHAEIVERVMRVCRAPSTV
jgi:hypothetical protein